MKLPRFVPILSAFTARVAGREMAQLLQSPIVLARALADTQTVVGHDGVLCIFDPLLLASACIGKQGGTHGVELRATDEILQAPPLTTLLESIQPLRHLLPDRALIFTTITGPALLYSQLKEALAPRGETCRVDPDYVVDVIRNVVRSVLALKADGIALIEQATPASPSELMRCHKTVRKLADFYDAGFLVFSLPTAEEQRPELHAHCVFDMASAQTGVGSVMGKLAPATASNVLPFTTAGDVPETTTVEELKTLLHELQCA